MFEKHRSLRRRFPHNNAIRRFNCEIQTIRFAGNPIDVHTASDGYFVFFNIGLEILDDCVFRYEGVLVIDIELHLRKPVMPGGPILNR